MNSSLFDVKITLCKSIIIPGNVANIKLNLSLYFLSTNLNSYVFVDLIQICHLELFLYQRC